MTMEEQARPPEDLIGLGEPVFTAPQVSEKAGLELEQTRRLWRAMGFVLIPDDEVFFTEADLDVLTRLAAFMKEGFADLDLVLGITRVMSQSVARTAEAQVDAMRQQLASSPRLAQRVAESDLSVAKETFDALEQFLVYVWRRHLADALQRGQVLAPQTSTVRTAVGFADLVGFTRLSREIDEDDLAALVEAFESATQEIATDAGGRIVKTIGDEVMFVADDAPAGAAMALALVESSVGELDAEIRVGMAIGQVTPHHGDYFGPTVNLASRAARVARPSSVLVDEGVTHALEGNDSFLLKPIPLRRVKGLGTPQLYVLRRPT